MLSTTETIIEGFPHPKIPPIISTPTYTTIAEVSLKLNANTVSIHSNLGDGAHGLFALTVKKSVHDTLSSTSFTARTNHGAQPKILSGSTGPQISQINREHNKSL